MPNPWGIEGNPLEDPENMVHIEGTGPGQPRADANDPNPDCLTRRPQSVLVPAVPQRIKDMSGGVCSTSPAERMVKPCETHFKGDLHLFFVDVILWGIQVLGI